MAATFTEITLEEIQTFLKRGFRALRPREGAQRGETYYDLFLSDLVAIRVWTSIAKGHGQAAGVGQDAIRVQLIGVKIGRPLMKGKAPIVKRTQNWKTSLQKRIEEMMESYEDREDYWEQRAGAPPPEPTPAPPQPTGRPTELEGSFTKLRNGDWGLRIQGQANPGDKVKTTRRDGRSQWLTVGEVVWRGKDRATGQLVTVTTITRDRTASEEEAPEFPEDAPTYDYTWPV